jgi:cyclase
VLRARIIPCLDVQHGRTVKGVGFSDMVDSGDPVEQAIRYAQDGADELVWLDIAATVEERELSLHQIGQVRLALNIPLTVGGGVRTVADADRLLLHGADKVSMNSAALQNPSLITEVAQRWGSQCTVVAVDAKRTDTGFGVFSHAGRRDAGRELGDWLKEAEARGAGEFLLTSIEQDGGQQGYDLEMVEYARSHTSRPIIVSGGAGTVDHLADMLDRGHQALLVASMLHHGRTTISALKRELGERGFAVRV